MTVNKTPNFNFIGNRNKAFIFSGTLLVVTMLSLIMHGGPNFSIDFRGGTVIQLEFQKPVIDDIGTIRTIVNSLNLGSPEIKTVGQGSSRIIQIMVKMKTEGTSVSDRIKEALSRQYPDNPFNLMREELVGPKIGNELKVAALIAIALSLVAIIVYIAIRFSLPYGVAAVIALFHDTFITIGAFSLLNYEISLPIVAALLTIIGYSLNDTIVIFDRIRENISGSLSKHSFEDKCNVSINQTLSRTFITGGTTIAAILMLFIAFFNSGDVIRDFSFAMLVGCISGIYSTVFIATPIVILWHHKWPIR
jgi:preprotein translocase subunit SecF